MSWFSQSTSFDPLYVRTFAGYSYTERRVILTRKDFRWYLGLRVLQNNREYEYSLGESDDTLQNWVFKCYLATFLVDPSQPYLTTTVVGGVSNSNPLLVGTGTVMDPNA